MAPDLESRRLNGGIRIGGLRVLAFAAWFALACETQTSPVLTGTLVLNVSSEAAIAGVNSWLVSVTGPSGSTSRSGAPGSTVEFPDLLPGQYVVRLQGSGGPGLVAEGQTNASVSAGEVTVATVPVVLEASRQQTVVSPTGDAESTQPRRSAVLVSHR